MYLELTTLSIFGYLGSLKAEFSREPGSEKEKDLPMAMDCTSLTLVDAAPSQSTSLLAETQDCSVELKDCDEGTCSAAPVAQNEFSSSQVEEQVELNQPASLSRENQVTGEEVKDSHEGESSAAPVPNPEKWSHEAIVARSNLRPERMEKLKLAANSGRIRVLTFCKSVVGYLVGRSY